jgi:hypothetical protein
MKIDKHNSDRSEHGAEINLRKLEKVASSASDVNLKA